MKLEHADDNYEFYLSLRKKYGLYLHCQKKNLYQSNLVKRQKK